MKIQEGSWRTRAGGGAVIGHSSIPGLIGAPAGGAANGGVLAGDLSIQQFLGDRLVVTFS